MNITDFVKENIVNLQEKDITNITKNKIDYISDYVNNWTYVNENSRYCNNLNFIDCMCNAGIYNDGTLTTSMRILKIFIDHAKIHKEKRYNIF